MIILALDLATKTGWATNQPEASGVEDFAVRRGESVGMKYVRFRAWLTEIVARVQPDIIVYEQAHHRGGAATESAAGFVTHLQAFVAENQQAGMKVELSNVHTSTVKKFATGKGNASKEEMMAAYFVEFSRKPLDDNESDAVFALHWALKEFGTGEPEVKSHG